MCACVSISMSDIGTMVEFIAYYRFHNKIPIIICGMCQRTVIVTVCKLYLTYYSFVVQRLELYIRFFTYLFNNFI